MSRWLLSVCGEGRDSRTQTGPLLLPIASRDPEQSNSEILVLYHTLAAQNPLHRENMLSFHLWLHGMR